MKKYIIYADEAWTHDFPKRYHNFFGGFLAEEAVFLLLEKEIRKILKSYNYRWEIKWSKISLRNKDLYRKDSNKNIKLHSLYNNLGFIEKID